MKENGKKREWVKTAAIVFLSVMLVLTFFSNTFMNYSLPEVATQYVQSGTITAKIRGTGTVESGDPYNVEVTESRKVASVAVRTGDAVKKGDVLMYLEDEESEELQAAVAALEKAQADYDKALLNADITAADIQAALSGVSMESYRAQITKCQNAINTEKDKLAPLELQKEQLEQWIADIETQLILEANADSSAKDRVSTAETALTNATNDLAAKKSAWESAQNARVDLANQLEAAKNYAGTVTGNELAAVQENIRALEAQLAAAQENENAAWNNYKSAEGNYNYAQANYEDAKNQNNDRQTSNVVTNLNDQKAEANVKLYHIKNELTAVQEAVADKEEDLNKLVKTMSNVMGLDTYLTAIAEAQEKVDELTAKTVDATITAPISGTINTINVTAGETTSAAVPVVVMQPEGQGYTLSFTVTNEQAKRLSVGDKADLVNAWRYDDVEVTLASIKPDKNNPGQQKLLTFNVQGSVVAGQTLNLSVGQKSANYDYIVPNSAIREDNNGQFILIVESKPSPLGTRYTATRVDVQVVASDDTQSAITGGVSGYEFVITTATKPVQAGELVRLAE